MIVSSFLLSCTSQEEKIKRNFIKTIELRLEQLKSENLQKKQQIECHGSRDPITLKDLHSYRAEYYEYQDSYSYDIQKTSSLVSPYFGVVTYKFICFEKRGHDEEECSRADWKLCSDTGKFFTDKQTFAYQNNEWILKSK